MLERAVPQQPHEQAKQGLRWGTQLPAVNSARLLPWLMFINLCCSERTAFQHHQHHPTTPLFPYLQPAAVQQQFSGALDVQPRWLAHATRARRGQGWACGHQAAHALAGAAEGKHLHEQQHEQRQVCSAGQA